MTDTSSAASTSPAGSSEPAASSESSGWPWPRGAATGIGSLPGIDVREAQRLVLGECPDLPHLVELPDRGAGADLIGRGAALLAALPVEIYAGQWRIAARRGHDLRVALDHLERDLDTLTELADGYVGPLKVQATGAWTLAASIGRLTGGALLRDAGAARDVTESLADGLRRHVAEVRARVPGAQVLLQLDEPALPAVLAGRVPTESGLGGYAPIDPIVVRAALTKVIEAVGVPVIVHCCAPGFPLGLAREAGARAVALDLGLVSGTGALDELGELLDAGLGWLAGAVDTGFLATPAGRAGRPPQGADVADRIRQVWRKLGFPAKQLASQVVPVPACGLAGVPPELARASLAACRDAGQRLAEAPD